MNTNTCRDSVTPAGDAALRTAVATEQPVVVTRLRNGCGERFIARFVATGDERDIIRLTRPIEEGADARLTTKPGEHLGVTFRKNDTTYHFTTVVARTPLDKTNRQDHGLVLRAPVHVRPLRRRLHDRVSAPRNADIRVLLWSDPHQRPARTRFMEQWEFESPSGGRLKDLSVGGIRMHTSAPIDFHVGARVNCAFKVPSGGIFRSAARLSHIEPNTDGTYSLGIEFRSSQATGDRHSRSARLAALTSQFRRAIP